MSDFCEKIHSLVFMPSMRCAVPEWRVFLIAMGKNLIVPCCAEFSDLLDTSRLVVKLEFWFKNKAQHNSGHNYKQITGRHQYCVVQALRIASQQNNLLNS